MTFNYTLTTAPCSSAKKGESSDGSIKYSVLGCPGSGTSNYTINCNNGRYVSDVEKCISNDISCNGSLNYEILGNQCQNYFPMEYEDIELKNSFNRINFAVGNRVFIEDITSALRTLLANSSLRKFFDWNSNLENILSSLGDGCGNNMNRIMSGKIKAITESGNNVIKFYNEDNQSGIEVFLNTISNNIFEIFWLELDNGSKFGLNNFHIRSSSNKIMYNGSNILYSSNTDKLLFPVLRNSITNLNTRLSLQSSNNLNRSQIMNTPRFRSRGSCTTGSLCLDTTLTPSFKNSTKNMYLAPIPYAQRLGNTFRSSLVRGTKKIVRRNCVDPQFGRLVGTGGPTLVNKF